MRSRQARGYTAALIHSLPNPLGDAVTAVGERGNRSVISFRRRPRGRIGSARHGSTGSAALSARARQLTP